MNHLLIDLDPIQIDIRVDIIDWYQLQLVSSVISIYQTHHW